MSTFRLYFRALFGTFFLKVFLREVARKLPPWKKSTYSDGNHFHPLYIVTSAALADMKSLVLGFSIPSE